MKIQDDSSAASEPAAAGAGSPTQSLDRAMALLECVAAHATEGMSLTDLSLGTGLSKPTAHRLLQGLRHLGMVDHDASRLYFPGLKLYRLGLAAGSRFDIARLAQEGMGRLAKETGDTVYLYLRAGDSAMCAARTVGAFPIRTLTLDVGDFRPLGLGAGSLALLAGLSDAVLEATLVRNRDRFTGYPHYDIAGLRAMVTRTRRDGYAINEGLMLPDMAAVGVAVRDADGHSPAALSVAAITSRMQPERREAIVKLLATEAALLEEQLRGRPATGTPATRKERS